MGPTARPPVGPQRSRGIEILATDVAVRHESGHGIGEASVLGRAGVCDAGRS